MVLGWLAAADDGPVVFAPRLGIRQAGREEVLGGHGGRASVRVPRRCCRHNSVWWKRLFGCQGALLLLLNRPKGLLRERSARCRCYPRTARGRRLLARPQERQGRQGRELQPSQSALCRFFLLLLLLLLLNSRAIELAISPDPAPSVVHVAVDGLDGIGDAVLAANLAAQLPGPLNRLGVVRGLVQGLCQAVGRELADEAADTQGLDLLAPEELIAKVGLDNRGDARPQRGTQRACTPMVAGRVDAWEEPVVRHRVDLEDVLFDDGRRKHGRRRRRCLHR